MRNRINEYKKRVNPKIAKDISKLIKPYFGKINSTSDVYKLQSLAMEIGKINIRVKKDVDNLLLAFQIAARDKIANKIKTLRLKEKPTGYSTKTIREFLQYHKIDNVYYSILFNAIYGKMMINLGLEDFKMVAFEAKKAKVYSAEIGNFGSEDIDKLMNFKLKGMTNAILILTGNEETTLDELARVWEPVLKYLPKDGKTMFAYKIEDVEKLQLNLLAVK